MEITIKLNVECEEQVWTMLRNPGLEEKLEQALRKITGLVGSELEVETVEID